jgi:hypothetical protein
LSPEFIFQIQPGGMIPDFRSFGILWMSEEPLEAAYNMEGAFKRTYAQKLLCWSRWSRLKPLGTPRILG